MEWKWAKANEKDLAKFINEKALELLPKLSVNRFDSIQNPEGRYALVEDIYKTLTNLDIRYAFEKYHPEEETQLIRTPSEILSKPGEGTCLDLSLLFCSLCFACDLLPLLIVIKGHALAAVSLNHTRSNDDKEHQWDGYGFPRSLFNTPELFNGEEKLAELQKLVDDGAYVAVECTGFAHTQSFNGSEPEAVGRNTNGVLSFRQSTIAGRKQLSNPNRHFQFAIDVAAARYVWKVDSLEIPDFEEHLSKISKMYAEQDLKNLKRVTAIGNKNESDGSVDMESHQKAETVEDSVLIGNSNSGQSNSGQSRSTQDIGSTNRTKVIGQEHQNV